MEKDYSELIKKVGKDNFDNRLMELRKTIDEFLSQAEYPDWVECNNRVLTHALLDYYTDIVRLRDFHSIENVKTDKVVAYLIFWILRRKPIQLTQDSEDERDIFVNERFACTMLLGECLLENMEDVKLTEDLAKKLGKYIDLLLYYFKYRQYNPQVIELLIESFKMGNSFNRVC